MQTILRKSVVWISWEFNYLLKAFDRLHFLVSDDKFKGEVASWEVIVEHFYDPYGLAELHSGLLPGHCLDDEGDRHAWFFVGDEGLINNQFSQSQRLNFQGFFRNVVTFQVLDNLSCALLLLTAQILQLPEELCKVRREPLEGSMDLDCGVIEIRTFSKVLMSIFTPDFVHRWVEDREQILVTLPDG